MFSTHTFADELITRNSGPESQRIFDDAVLAELRKWCLDPSKECEREILEEDEGRVGGGEGGGRSLTAFMVRRKGEGRSVLTEGEMVRLRGWFEGGCGGVEG